MPSIELTPEARLLRQIFGEKCKLSEDQDPEYIEEVNKKHLVELYRELKGKYENDPPKVKKANLTLYRYK